MQIKLVVVVVVGLGGVDTETMKVFFLMLNASAKLQNYLSAWSIYHLIYNRNMSIILESLIFAWVREFESGLRHDKLI